MVSKNSKKRAYKVYILPSGQAVQFERLDYGIVVMLSGKPDKWGCILPVERAKARRFWGCG